MIAYFVISPVVAVVASVPVAGDVRASLPDRNADLNFSAAGARGEQTCFGLSKDRSEARFRQKYAKRLHKLGDWMTSQFGEEALNGAYNKRYEGSIIVGGCPRSGSPREDGFRSELNALEAAVRSLSRDN